MINVFHAFVGLVTPVRVSGRALFRQKLKDFGVDISKIPSDCLNELADAAIDTAEKVSRMTGRPLQTQVVVFVEGQAGLVKDILRTREDRFFQDPVGPEFRGQIEPILARHGVEVPPA